MAVVDISNTFQMSNLGEHIDNTDVINSNRNLLDNPWWGSGEVVNQRGATSMIHANYGIDRWIGNFGSGSGTVTVTSDGVQFAPPSGTYVGVYQIVPLMSSLVGKIVTASALLSDGTVVSGTRTLTASGTANFTSSSDAAALIATPSNNRFYVRTYSTQTVRAVKLELGSYSTLINDTPPDYGEELRKCMRYAVKVPLSTGQASASGFANSTTSIRFNIPVPVPMRTAPSIALTGSCVAIGGGAKLAISGFNATAVLADCGVTVACTVSGATQYQAYALSSDNTTSYILLSADL